MRRNGKRALYAAIAFMLWAATFVLPAIILALLVFGFGLLCILIVAALARDLGFVTGIDWVDRHVERVADWISRPFLKTSVGIIADDAMRRAGYRPQDTGLRLEDIGLLVYHGEHSDPRIYRSADVPTDASHIRPFAVLSHQGLVQAFKNPSEVQFLLVDEHNKTEYVADVSSWLNRGQNFVTPPTWFPLREQQTSGSWAVGVTVAGTLLAIHEFGWLEVGGKARAEFNGEGEIDQKSQRWAELGMQEPVSVDELLEEQGVEVSEIGAGEK